MGEFVLPAIIRFVFVQAVNGGFCQHDKLRSVDGVNPYAKNGSLPPSLAFFTEERVGVLELVAVYRATECLLGFERRAILGVNVADASFRYAHQRHPVDSVLPRKETEVNAAPQHSALHARLICRSDNATFGKRSSRAP